MKLQFKTLLILLSAALNVAFVGGWMMHAIRASNEKKPAPSGEGASAAMPALYRQSGATEQQWQQLRPQLEAFRESALIIFKRINERRQELLGLLANSQADRASISAKQKEIRNAQAQMQDLVIAHVLAEKELLTPAQRQKYFELLAQRSGTLCENLMEGLRPVTTSGDGHSEAPPAKR
jgi:Spy/CpxP family protein refolding chaperone